MNSQPLVLVADDEPRITKLVAIALSEEGFRVVTANGGEQALQKAEEVRPEECHRLAGNQSSLRPFPIGRHLNALGTVQCPHANDPPAIPRLSTALRRKRPRRSRLPSMRPTIRGHPPPRRPTPPASG